MSVCSAIPREFEQSARLCEWAVACQGLDLEAASAVKPGSFEHFAYGYEWHGGQRSGWATLDVQLRAERRADPRLLKRILTYIKAVPHVEVYADGGMV